MSTSFVYIRVSLLLFPLNEASVDIVDDEGSFQFSPEAEFILDLHVQITLETDTEAVSRCFTQLLHCKRHIETLSIQMAFKRVIALNRMIRSHVNLVICLK